MKITRRHFLGASTGAAALFSIRAASPGKFGPASGGRRECVVLDLKSQCALSESFWGYWKVLGGAKFASTEGIPQSITCYENAIIPGIGRMDAASAEILADYLQAGGAVLLESGGGYLNPNEFRAHQQVLNCHFNVRVDQPVDFWAHSSTRGIQMDIPSRRKGPAHGPAPYIDYIWPYQTKVRDFSRVVPLAAQGGDVIGFAGKLPVALRKRVGKGALIFLGSPLGPHLLAGDVEAGRWLHSVLIG
jgi:hypothetical protein